jgi:hypothetical protein
MKYLWSLLIVVFLTACGYKPTAYYSKEVLGDRIHVDVTISRKDPKNSVLIKDAVNESVITRLGAKLSSKETATSELFVKIGSTTFSPILYNKNGYVTSYKANVKLDIKYITKDGNSESFATSGEYDFPIAENSDGTTNSVISDSKRFEAIKLASLDALNEFVSRIALKGMK